MTELCKLMKDYGSDKGDSWHNYTKYYDRLFGDNRNNIKHVFEVGIGTTNPAFKSHMKPEFTPGGSLRGWRDYFPNATIYGGDIDPDVLFTEDRIETFQMDQTNPDRISDLWDLEFGDIEFDIFIDDGLHTLDAAFTLFNESMHMVKDTGIYIIEDIQRSELTKYAEAFDRVSEDWGVRPAIFNFPHRENQTDNTIMVFTFVNSAAYDKQLKDMVSPKCPT